MQVQKSEDGRYEVQVDEHTYSFEKWGADEALDVLLSVVPIVGGPLAAAATKMQALDLDDEAKPEVLAAVMGALTGGFNEKVVKSIIVKVSSHKVMCDGKVVGRFNDHYKDRLPHLFKVVRAGLEVQYGNFFGAVAGVVFASPPRAGRTNRIPAA